MFYKNISDGYITQVGTGIGDVEITEEEYCEIMGTFKQRPIPPSGFDYRLTIDYEWELYELPIIEEVVVET